MNPMLRIAGLFALGVTIVKIICGLWDGAPEAVRFVADNSPFFYGCALGIGIAGFTRNLWVIIFVIGFAFVLLKIVGL